MSYKKYIIRKNKNEIYNFLKNVALVILPAIATLIITIFEIWNIPYGEQIGVTITAVDTALGILLGISSRNYYKNLHYIHFVLLCIIYYKGV